MYVFKDIEFRALVLEEAKSFNGNKRQRLIQITLDLQELKDLTIQDVSYNTMYTAKQDMEKVNYYREQRETMKRIREDKLRQGALGSIPPESILDTEDNPPKQLPPAKEEKNDGR